MAKPQRSGLSAQEYLAWEAEQEDKHEFMAGEIFAMVGASTHHVIIAGNIFAALRSHLRGGPCRPYIADMKLRVERADAWFYPDVMVCCDPEDCSSTPTDNVESTPVDHSSSRLGSKSRSSRSPTTAVLMLDRCPATRL